MTFAIDVNPMVFATDTDSPFHERALGVMDGVSNNTEIVYLFWPVTMGFLRIVTDRRVLRRPLSQVDAMEAITNLIALPNVRTGAEGPGFWAELQNVTKGMVVRGKLFPDAHLVALMRTHGVTTILTHDRDFRKFDGIRVLDPFQ